MKNQINFKIRSVVPLLMHSERSVNPFEPLVKQMKSITGKRKKTDEDLIEIARLEFLLSLYHDGKHYFIPAVNVFATGREAAKQLKLGTAWKQAIIVDNDATFDFKHKSKSPDELWDLVEYRDVRSVGVNGSKIMRTRPIFKEWSSEFTIFFDETKFNHQQIIDIIKLAGQYTGLGDYRPRFGRFEIEEAK